MNKVFALSSLVSVLFAGILEAKAAERTPEAQEPHSSSLAKIMAGAAEGGPIGAIAGALVEVFGGSSRTSAAELARNDEAKKPSKAYRYRSSNRAFAGGEELNSLRGFSPTLGEG